MGGDAGPMKSLMRFGLAALLVAILALAARETWIEYATR